jgi:hypothetical protein
MGGEEAWLNSLNLTHNTTVSRSRGVLRRGRGMLGRGSPRPPLSEALVGPVVSSGTSIMHGKFRGFFFPFLNGAHRLHS